MKYIKTAISIWLLSTCLSAEESGTEGFFDEEVQGDRLKEKGLFIGIDYESIEAETRYRVSSQNKLYNIPGSSSDTYKEPAFKLGYQYRYTRIYFKYSTLDEKAEDYTVKSSSYEVNTEYLPIFYRGDTYAIRGLFGGAIGYLDSDLKDLSDRLAEEAEFVGLTDFSDKQALYGIQIGMMLEMTNGLSAELGYRYRRGHLLESENSDGTVTFETKRKQWYLGLNYLF
jgi:opacity protein-like surface antigen